MNSEEEIIFITENEAGNRIDKILADRYKELHSRSYFQYLINQKSVLLNGETVKKQTRPQEGDEIQIEFILTPEITVTPEPIPLDILFEDEFIIAINKQSGLVVHPAPGNWTGTFVNALLYHCKNIQAEATLRPGIVHRLDKDTSGVLIAAKTLEAHQKLIEQFSNREVYKEYLAISLGNPGERVVEAPIGRHPIERKKMAVVESGRYAKTIVRTLKYKENIALVQCILETGRTHQIRVHLKYLNSSILGDPLYGSAQMNKKYGARRQMLHASRLRLKHPITQQELELKAPIPDDMLKLLEHLEIN